MERNIKLFCIFFSLFLFIELLAADKTAVLDPFTEMTAAVEKAKNLGKKVADAIIYIGVLGACGSLIWLFVGGEQNGEKTKKTLQSIAIIAFVVLAFSIIAKKVIG